MTKAHYIEQIRFNVPDKLLHLPVWLMWRSEDPDNRKVPYYCGGKRRNGALDSPEDRAQLVTFEDAAQAFNSNRMTGLGIALGEVPGEEIHLSGIDLDDVYEDQVGNRLDQRAIEIMAAANCYAERSPSGLGLKIFGIGDIGTLRAKKKEGDAGLEIYSRARFFAVTARRLNSAQLDDLTDAARIARALFQVEIGEGTAPAVSRDGTAQAPRIANGSRNNTLTSMLGRMRKAGATTDEMEAAGVVFNQHRCAPPLPDREVQAIARSVGRYEPGKEEIAEPVPHRSPLDWNTLASITPPARDWIIDHWIPRNEVTLLSGPGGIGKTGVAQALGSCVAIQREYLDWVPSSRKVLLWAGEDDPDELHRRQAAIAAQLDVGLADFAGRLFLESYHRTQIDLAAVVQHRLVATPMLRELREQIGDYGAELVILDNIARLFGGNENDRHQVSAFITMLNNAAAPTSAGIILLGHPAKAAGSEFSGSTAWEGAVRTRLYLGAKLPDEQDNGETADDTIRYLCRRKANYSTKDWRRIKYTNGVMVPEVVDHKPMAAIGGDYAKDTVLAAVRKLASMNEYGNASTASPGYLPKLAKTYDLLDQLNSRQFIAAMVELRKAGRLTLAKVGQYSNRSPRMGLVEATI